MPLRLTRPWLLLDWIYRMTDNAAAEVNQKARLNNFTKKVSIGKHKKTKNVF